MRGTLALSGGHHEPVVLMTENQLVRLCIHCVQVSPCFAIFSLILEPNHQHSHKSVFQAIDEQSPPEQELLSHGFRVVIARGVFGFLLKT